MQFLRFGSVIWTQGFKLDISVFKVLDFPESHFILSAMNLDIVDFITYSKMLALMLQTEFQYSVGRVSTEEDPSNRFLDNFLVKNCRSGITRTSVFSLPTSINSLP